MNESNHPKIDVPTFVLSVSSAAMMALQTADAQPDLELARQNIDLLEMFQDKTRGNLTTDETRLLEQLLFEIRMKFVELQQKRPSKK